MVLQRHQVGSHLHTGTCGKFRAHWLAAQLGGQAAWRQSQCCRRRGVPADRQLGSSAAHPCAAAGTRLMAARQLQPRAFDNAAQQHSTTQQLSPAQTWAAGRGSSCGQSGTCGSTLGSTLTQPQRPRQVWHTRAQTGRNTPAHRRCQMWRLQGAQSSLQQGGCSWLRCCPLRRPAHGNSNKQSPGRSHGAAQLEASISRAGPVLFGAGAAYRPGVGCLPLRCRGLRRGQLRMGRAWGVHGGRQWGA